MNILRYMLIFVPIAFLAEWFFPNPLLVFALSCIALIPLAGLLGEATEELAIHVGPKVGGLLNATLGNAAELIITIVALREGTDRTGQSIDHRLDSGQPAAYPRSQPAARRSASRHSNV
jgi:Ca2+/H+ antiporter